MDKLGEALGELAYNGTFSRFEKALVAASRVHGDQRRKGSDLPYISHLLAVAALVQEDGGDEDETVAGLLHDSIEDQQVTRAELVAVFGPRVAEIVEECSDTDVQPKPPWRSRKEAYIEHLQHASEGAVRVSLADKLHNSRMILRDFQRDGEQVWERFNAPVGDQLWYYRELLKVFSSRSQSWMVGELRGVVNDLESSIRRTSTR